MHSYFSASGLIKPNALTAASLMSATSHLKSGTISLYIAVDNPLLLSFRSVFIESGEELNERTER